MSTPSPEVFEKLGSFYLGREYDLAAGSAKDNLLLYDAKDLCTHAMCVGMTGSGKTGLCISLLEEAAIDGIPAICVDPKGDLANLLLTFPELQGEDFEPWLEPGSAARRGLTLPEYAEQTATTWRQGLAAWGQTAERISRFAEAVDAVIYTPGSNTGMPLTVLKSFSAPPKSLLADTEVWQERVTGAASGLLALLGLDADPLLSPAHILISSILDQAWRDGHDLALGDLIRLIQSPGIDRIGVVDLDTFMPPAERTKLAMQLNNLLASPAFRSWLEGEPLSIERLLHTPAGKPRLSILSIAHLADNERMFFVTNLLGELVTWMRTQRGTGSLRAMFYMDEVAGYFPPVKNPPSKPPMLTLLKQARAYGLGVTLATQNPVDLDYKGLSNIGTWFLGRLQTERDKARVLEGLEGAAVQSGQRFNRAAMEQTLAGLGQRVFLMNNVHEDQPTVFQSRWALSFLAGPLARDQISRLMDPRKQANQEDASDQPKELVRNEPKSSTRPAVPSGIAEQFIAPRLQPAPTAELVYRPGVVVAGSLHFVRASANLDQWQEVKRLVPCTGGVPDDGWESSEAVAEGLEFGSQPKPDFDFSDLPSELCSRTKVDAFGKSCKDYLYRHHALTLFKSPLLKMYAPAGCSEGEARVGLRQAAREARDRATEKLRKKYRAKMQAIEKKIRTAEERLSRESDQYSQTKLSSLLSVGTSIVGAFMGRKAFSRTNVSKVTTAARSAGRASQQQGDVQRAEEALGQLKLDLQDLDDRLARELEKLGDDYDIENLSLDATVIAPRKSDLKVSDPAIVWTPWQVDETGIATKLF